MDYLFLTILGLYGVKGFLKGFVRMLLSLFSVVIVAILAYMIVLKLSNGQILFGIYDYFNSIFEDIFNNLIPGHFSSCAIIFTIQFKSLQNRCSRASFIFQRTIILFLRANGRKIFKLI